MEGKPGTLKGKLGTLQGELRTPGGEARDSLEGMLGYIGGEARDTGGEARDTGGGARDPGGEARDTGGEARDCWRGSSGHWRGSSGCWRGNSGPWRGSSGHRWGCPGHWWGSLGLRRRGPAARTGHGGPVRGMVEDPPELFQEEWEINGHLWVSSHHCHCPIQGPVSEGGYDECHLGPIRPKPGGLAADDIMALLQETQTLVEIPRVTLGRW